MTLERPMFPPVDPTRRHLLTIAAAGAMSIAAVSATALPIEGDTELVHAASAIDPAFALIEAKLAACCPLRGDRCSGRS